MTKTRMHRNDDAKRISNTLGPLLVVCVVGFYSARTTELFAESPSKAQAAATDGAEAWVTSIARLNEGSYVAATANGLLLRPADVVAFEPATPNEMKPLYSHSASVWCVVACSDGKFVASSDYRGNLVVFDTASQTAKTYEKALERWCQAMMLTQDNQTIVAGNEAGKLIAWDVAAAKVAKSVELDGHAITGLAISPDAATIAASDGGGHVHLLKLPGLESIGKINISEDTAWCVTFADNGKTLFVGSGDRNLYRCEAKPDAKVESIAKGSDWITELAVSPSGQLAAAEIGGTVHFPTTGGIDSMSAKSGVWSLCWNGEGQLFSGTRKDGIVTAGRSWKWTEPAKAPTLKPQPAVDAKPDGSKADDVKADGAKAGASSDTEPEEKATAEEAADSKPESKPVDEPKNE